MNKKLKIYVASSWRNRYQPEVVSALRADGHEVYDFRNPEPGNDGFRWTQIGLTPDATQVVEGRMVVEVDQYARALDHQVAQDGFALDLGAVLDADLCVLVLPSGRSASWEYGYHCGMTRRPGIVYMPERCEPELMYLGSTFVGDLPALAEAVFSYAEGKTSVAASFHASVVREHSGVFPPGQDVPPHSFSKQALTDLMLRSEAANKAVLRVLDEFIKSRG